MKILILGRNGQLGSCLFEQLKNSSHDLKFTTRIDLDLTDIEATERFILSFNPSLIINATSYNAVDMAEDDYETANKVNNLALKNIATISKTTGSKFIHISTDYIFDGRSGKPYKTCDEAKPISKYGLSKLNGELSIKSSMSDYLIIRTSWLFSEYGNNFLKTMLRIGANNDSVKIINDEIGIPTYAQDLASAIINTFSSIEGATCPWGVYHYSGNKPCSWFDFAERIYFHAKKMNYRIPLEVQKISASEYPTVAKRPKYSVLENKKFTEAFGINPSNWDEGIIRALRALERG